jgi:hypothetical protein
MVEKSGVNVDQLVQLLVDNQAFPDGELRVGAYVNLDSPPRAALGILPDGSGYLAFATQAETCTGPRRSGDQAAQVGQRP